MSRVAAITGGARGLGLATGRVLAQRGYSVAIGDLDGDLARAEAAALPGPGPHAGYELDVTDGGRFESFLDEVERDLGPLEVLVNNAGIMPVVAFMDEHPDTARRQVEINLLGVMTGSRLALQRMTARGRGHLVNVASAAGRVPVPGEAVYSATKHAVVGLGEAISVEIEGTGVHISTVMPSLADTELASGMKPPRFVPLVKPEEVAEAIARVLEQPKLEVYVPAWTTPIIRFQLLLPPRGRAFLRKVFRIKGVGSDVDTRAREAYVERQERDVAATRD